MSRLSTRRRMSGGNRLGMLTRAPSAKGPAPCRSKSTDGSKLALDDDEIWHLRAPSERHVGLNVEKAWKLTEGVSDIRVVLCDFGVDYEHPALAQVDQDLAIDFDHTLDGKGVLLTAAAGSWTSSRPMAPPAPGWSAGSTKRPG